MSKVELRALGQCGRNRAGDIFTERKDRAKILVEIGRAEYLTRDMSAAPRSAPGLPKTVAAPAKSDTPKQPRGRPRTSPIAEPESAHDPFQYTAPGSAAFESPAASDYHNYHE